MNLEWKFVCMRILIWMSLRIVSSSSSFRVGYGESCNNATVKCHRAKWLTCQEGICKCSKPEEMLYDTFRESCVVRAGERCRYVIGGDSPLYDYEFMECVENAECDYINSQHICTCDLEGYYESVDGHCKAQSQHGGPCESSIECFGYLHCVNNRCDCNPENSRHNPDIYRRTSRLCVGILGKPCIDGICEHGCRCLTYPSTESKCACASGWSEWEGKCYVGHGKSCSQMSDNSMEHCSQQFNCVDAVCRCKYPATQFYDEHLEKCISNVNGPCETNASCVRNSECVKIKNAYTQCRCKEGYIDVDGFCDKNYGSTCTSTPSTPVNYQRDVNSFTAEFCERCDRQVPLSCVNGHCNCEDDGMGYDKERRQCVWLVGFKCNADKDDCVENADCLTIKHQSLTNKYCECRNNYEVTRNRTCVVIRTTSEENQSTIVNLIEEEDGRHTKSF